jgi:hypothetical protein
MRYRLTFLERRNREGEPSETPTDSLEIQAADGVILDKNMVERDAPLAMHGEETLEEDDDFLSIGSETWDYDVADGRDKEFLAAVTKSRMVMECIPLDDDRAIA